MARSLLEQNYGKIKRLNQIYSSEHLENVEIVAEDPALFDSLGSSKETKLFHKLKSSVFPFHKVSVVVPVFNGATTAATYPPCSAISSGNEESSFVLLSIKVMTFLKAPKE